jgi:glycosyltransferase involved in cell wall biosynthesis
MKAVFISYDGLSDALGGSQILPYVFGLKEAGYDYSILSFEKAERFKTNGAAISSLLREKQITWVHKKYTKTPALLSTLLDLGTMRQSIRRIIKEKSPDVLHCRSYVSMFAAFPLAKKHKLKLVFDMRGFWIDERVEGNIWDTSNPIYSMLYKYLKRKEKVWLRNSDVIISLTYKAKQYISSAFEVDLNRIYVIPCCADADHFNANALKNEISDALKKELKITDKERVLVYAGSVGTWYLADEMLTQFSRLNHKGFVDKFLWLTNESSNLIFTLADKIGIDRSKLIIRQVQRHDMPLFLSLANLGIFYIKPSFSKSASSPTKLGEMLLMGIPVICNAGVGDLDNFFSRHSVGLCHKLESKEAPEISDVQKLMQVEGETIRQVAIETLGLTSGVEKYKLALSQL